MGLREEYLTEELAGVTAQRDNLLDELSAAKRAVRGWRECWATGFRPPRQWPIGLHWRRLARQLVIEHHDSAKAVDYLTAMLDRELQEIAAQAARLPVPADHCATVEDLAISLVAEVT